MPETPFTVELPDGSFRACYSPSSIVREYFEIGDVLPIDDFVHRSREALGEASDRVRAKFGYSCTSASASIRDIETWASSLPSDATVKVIHI